MRRKFQAVIVVLTIFVSLLYVNQLNSSEKFYEMINADKISRLYEDRIAYQQVEYTKDPGYTQDDSVSNLLIVNNKEVYLMRDGYDSPVETKKLYFGYELSKRVHKSLWRNKINAKPDYIRIMDRRTEKLLNVTEEFVDKNFGDFYRSVRNSFVNKHVRIFTDLMLNREDSQLKIIRKPLTPPFLLGTEDRNKAIYATTVSGKTIDEKTYFAEDADGDKVTETFTVNLKDGFFWGYKSGPNIVNIQNNTQEDMKQIIGKICHDAYFGTDEEEKVILANFPPDVDIIELHGLKKIDIKASEKSEKKPAAKKGTGQPR